jgi:hypothetical protein
MITEINGVQYWHHVAVTVWGVFMFAIGVWYGRRLLK